MLPRCSQRVTNSGQTAVPKKTIEDTYQKKSQLEHILLRPDTYIGSVERNTAKMWVINEETQKMELRELSFVPGLYKIFDEILVNAADNKQRDPSMNMIQVEINQEENRISVWNNGRGVPVQIHQEHGIYVPDLIFGHLLTSSNYDDNDKKTTGGRNGFGAKLANIFSTEFTVRTYDGSTGQMFKKTWRDSMRKSEKAQIESKKSQDFTEVTFKPDLAKFGMDKLDDDIVALMKKRVWDIAGCSDKSLKVRLNGKLIPVADFREYVNLYPVGEALKNQQFESIGRWTVCVAVSPCGFQQVSFVNSIWTFKGGKHVQYILDQVTDRIIEKLKRKISDLKPFQIKPHLWIFINCLIENPAFDSQTKENLTTVKTKFGSECKLSEKMLDAVCKGELMLRIMDSHNNKTESLLNKNAKGKRSNRVTGLPKLEEANEAGGANAHLCTLVLTEGDSAKTLAISGFSVVGRDYWGVFPLRGKLLNVRDAPAAVILKNAEIQNIMKILRLQVGQKYTDTKSLRYGHVMIMADQDHDGSHIKGLLVNFIHHFWPELLSACPGFLVQFITPIVKVTKRDSVLSFYSIPEYRQWQEATADFRQYKTKYYKGLGTSTPAEAKEYFHQLQRHRIEFEYRDEADQDAILLAFDKNRIEDRKAWVTGYREEYPNFNVSSIRICDFVNKELVLFSRADCERSIPSVIDGFKPSLRKILFCCFKKNLKTELKVAQLSGYVSEHSAYHHGEVSLQSSIIGMAQDYCGSNNMNLLEPIGQFGTRLSGGKDASQARYLFTKLSPLARALFPPDDDEVLSYKEDDGLSVEPHWYVPIIPMVLVNGCKGIGTGYATSIPNHNPVVLVDWIRCKLRGQELPALKPWYRDFTNNDSIIPNPNMEGRSYQCFGTVREVGDTGTVINITELPVEKWTEDYKNFLEELLKEEVIHDFREHHTDVTVDFEVQFDPETLRDWRELGLQEKLRLRSAIPISNLVCFDHHGNIAKYETTKDIFEEFFQVRLDFYRKRKDFLIERMRMQCEKLKNMVRFITEVVEGQLIVMKKKRVDLIAELRKRGYKAFPPEPKRTVAKGAVDYDAPVATEQDADQAGDTAGSADYNYLLSMPIWSLTYERVEKLRKELADKEQEFKILYSTDFKDLWLRDLDNLMKIYQEVEEKRRKALLGGQKKKEADPKAKGKKADKSSRLENSKFIPKRSEAAKKLTEDHLAKLAREQALQKKKEERELQRMLKGGEPGERPAKRQKKGPAAAEGGRNDGDDLVAGMLSQPAASSSNLGAESSNAPQPKQGKISSLFAKKPAPVAQRPVVDVDGDDDASASSPPVRRVPPPPPPPKPRAKLAPRPPKARDDSSDDAGGDVIDSDEEDGEVAPTAAAQRSARTRKPVSYKLDDNSSIEESDDDDDGDSAIRRPVSKQSSKRLKKGSASDGDETFDF